MKWKLETKKINGIHYIVGCRTTINRPSELRSLELAKPFEFQLVNEYGKPIWIWENGKILNKPIELTDDEYSIIKKRDAVIKIHERYKIDDELKIIRRKLSGLDTGEFDEYNSFVESILGEINE